MALEAIEKEVTAALHGITKTHPDLKKRLEDAHGYVVFPSVGRASLVLGGTFGRGQVFEHSQPVGFASMGQVTLGVQVGGDTFSELVLFNTRDSFERFKRGRYAFTANASAVIIRAAASGTINFEKDVVAQAFGRGGLLLEISLGAQKFNFRKREEAEREESERQAKRERAERERAEREQPAMQEARPEAAAPERTEEERPEERMEERLEERPEERLEGRPEEEPPAPERRGIAQRTRDMVSAATSKVGRVPSRIVHRYRHTHP